MCADCQKRFHTNVWRILDCKNEGCREYINQAPAVVDLLGEESTTFFREVQQGLDAAGVSYEVDHRLVRGLDYYEHTVYEVVHPGLGAQDAIAGGGRYSLNLSGVKKPVQGVGFAVGMERLLMAREAQGCSSQQGDKIQVFLASLCGEPRQRALALARHLRSQGLNVVTELQDRSMKAQLRQANKCGARLVLILGDEELAQGQVTCRDMSVSEQQSCAIDEVTDWVLERLNENVRQRV